jgi:hypothetical protein
LHGINRTAWRTIGGFDIAFGQAEENDWCHEQSRRGSSTFWFLIYLSTTHGGSFGIADTRRLTERNLKRLYTRHPIYTKKVRGFNESDPAGPLRNFLIMLVDRAATRKSPALIIDHEIGGGANFYRREAVARRLESGQPVLLLSPNVGDRSSIHLDYLSTYGNAYFEANDLSVLDEILDTFRRRNLCE